MHTAHPPVTAGTIHSRIRREALPGLGMLLLAIGMVTSAVLGPLVTGIMSFAVSEDMENQLIGGEIASLLLAAPLATLTGLLWLRGHRLAPVVAIGPAIYATYIYTQYVIGPEYSRYDGNAERAFPLYLLLVLGGWSLAARAWIELSTLALPEPGPRLGHGLGWILIGLNSLFALAWLASIAGVIVRDAPTAEYRADTTLFWVVRLMDLGFVIPIGIITGVALLRRHPLRTRLTYAWLGAQTLLTSAVCGMAWVMTLRDDPAANPVFLVATTVIAVGLAGFVVALWRRAAARPER